MNDELIDTIPTQVPNFKHIQFDDKEAETGKVFLDPDLIQRLEDMSEEERGKMRQHFPETEELSQIPCTLKFENWGAIQFSSEN